MKHVRENSTQNELLGRFCPGHKKPLMAMVEVTHRCNMNCPICFSDSRDSSSDIPISRIRAYLEQLMEVTDTPIPIQISGGEPSLRDDLGSVIGMARQMGYRNIELITNGIRIAKDAEYLDDLKANGLTAVYLQFDGLQPHTTVAIRGRDMTNIRHKALSVIRKAGLCCTLAVVVTKGVNENEIGDIVRFGIDNIDVVRAINFQSATRLTGRFNFGDEYSGYGLNELLSLIEGQTGIGADTFLSDHLGHSSCNAMSPIFITDGKWEPLFKYIGEDDLAAFLGADGRDKILAAFAGKKALFFQHLLSPKGWRLLAKAAPIFGSNPYSVLRSQHLLLFAKSFMEKDAIDPKRIKQCCYAITGEKGVVSFCAYNNLYRFAG